MNHFRKMVHNGEDDSVSIRECESGNEIHCHVGPGMTGNRQGSEETCGWTMRGLASCTHHTSHQKLTHVSGMETRLGEPLPGSGLSGWAARTIVSISQVAAPTIQRNYGLRVRRGCVAGEEVREHVRLPILGTGMVRDGMVGATQEERPTGLARI